MNIAKVAVDISLNHLDHLFDYRIPEKMADIAKVGVRVRVRFAGRLVDGLIVELTDKAQQGVKLACLERVVSPEKVLSASTYSLVRSVADHYGGVCADVIRLAIPPRHAATESAIQREWPNPKTEEMPDRGLLNFAVGKEFIDKISTGAPVRAHWLAPASFRGSDDWVCGAVQSVIASLRAEKGAIVIVPNAKDLSRIIDRLADFLGLGAIAQLYSEMGKSTRYRNFLAISRGQAKVVVGTRAAVFAPVANLGLIVIYDDGDDLLAEQRAPYPHARDVAAIRANLEGCGLLFISHSRTCEIQSWVNRGWLADISAAPAIYRRLSPGVRVAYDDSSPSGRLPRMVFETIRAGLAAGPTLVQVLRSGYLPALACQKCRTVIRCPSCNGPLQMRGKGHELTCKWCNRIVTAWRCTNCGGQTLRAPVVGSGRTAEELGRAFPGYRVISSFGDHVVASVGNQPALVVATPGAEPVAENGYSAAVLLDGQAMLHMQDLRAGEETFRRWLNVAALVRSGQDGGTVCVVGEPNERTVQALVRMDAAGFAQTELSDRNAAGFPPAWKMISVDSTHAGLEIFREHLSLPQGSQLLGPTVHVSSGKPVGDEETERILLRCGLEQAAALTASAKAAASLGSARKSQPVRIQVDPLRL